MYKYWFRDKCRDLRSRCERFARGYAKEDIWNMDTWLRETMEPMLRYLAEHHHAIPWELEKQYPDDADKRWTKILVEMADCLHYSSHDIVDEELVDESLDIKERWSQIDDIARKNKSRFCSLLSAYFYDLWD